MRIMIQIISPPFPCFLPTTPDAEHAEYGEVCALAFSDSAPHFCCVFGATNPRVPFDLLFLTDHDLWTIDVCTFSSESAPFVPKRHLLNRYLALEMATWWRGSTPAWKYMFMIGFGGFAKNPSGDHLRIGRQNRKSRMQPSLNSGKSLT